MAYNIEPTRIYQRSKPMLEAGYLASQRIAPAKKLPTQIRATGMAMPRFITPPKVTRQPKIIGAPNMNAPVNPAMNVKLGAPMMNHPHYR